MSNQEPLLNTKNWIIGGSALIIGVFILNLLINGTIEDFIDNRNVNTEPTFYDTGNPEDMTEKELKEYLRWKEKQKENLKIFD